MVGGSLLGSTGTQAQSDMTQRSANSVSERKTAELSSGPTVEENRAGIVGVELRFSLETCL